MAPRPPPPARATRRPRRRRAVAVVGGVLGLGAAGAGGWLAVQHLTFWERQRVETLVPLDDDHALRTRADVRGRRVQVALVDGDGREVWTRVHDLSATDESTTAVPLPGLGVGTVGARLAFALDDGRPLWRRAALPGDGCNTFIRHGDLLVTRCGDELLAPFGARGEELIGLDPRTGDERWRVPAPPRLRWWPAPGALVVDGDGDPERGLVIDMATGETTPLHGHVCQAGGSQLVFDGGELAVHPTDDPTDVRSASVPLEIPAPQCGTRGPTFVVGRGTAREATLAAIDRETLAVRWSLELPLRHRLSSACMHGDFLDLGGELPRLIPVRVGGAVHLVDLDAGRVVATEVDRDVGHACTTGVVVHDGRAYLLGDRALRMVVADAPRTIDVALAASLAAPASFAGSTLWLRDAARIGRLSSADLAPRRGSEWLVASRSETSFGAR